MATMTIKATYALDLETHRALEAMARRWGVSKSEALRRAIRGAAAGVHVEDGALEALDELQASCGLTPAKAASWQARVARERRASSRRREKAVR